VLKPAHFLPFGQFGLTLKATRSFVFKVQQYIEKMQPDTGDQNRRHGYQRDTLPGAGTVALKRGTNQRTLITTKQTLYPAQRNRVDIPGVTREIANLVNQAIIGRMEAVVHARGQSQGDKAAVLPIGDRLLVTQKVLQRVGIAFRLEHLSTLNIPMRTNDGIHWTAQHIRGGVYRTQTFAQLTGKTRVHASKVCFFRLTQIQIRKKTPNGNRCIAYPGLFNLAKPAHETGQGVAGQSVGQQEVDVFIGQNGLNVFAQLHGYQILS